MTEALHEAPLTGNSRYIPVSGRGSTRLTPPRLDDLEDEETGTESLNLKVIRFMADPEWFAFQPKWD